MLQSPLVDQARALHDLRSHSCWALVPCISLEVSPENPCSVTHLILNPCFRLFSREPWSPWKHDKNFRSFCWKKPRCTYTLTMAHDFWKWLWRGPSTSCVPQTSISPSQSWLPVTGSHWDRMRFSLKLALKIMSRFFWAYVISIICRKSMWKSKHVQGEEVVSWMSW